jgi:nicotinic acid phosphoribosyltransferase
MIGKWSFIVCGSGSLILCVSALALAPPEPPKLQGDSYFFSMGQMYDLHAFQHARMLHKFTVAHQMVPAEVLAEHIAAIRMNVAAAEKSFARLSEQTRHKPDTAAKLAEIRAYNKKILQVCDQVQQTARDQKLQVEALREQAAQIKQHLTAGYQSSQNAASAANIFTEQWDEPGHGAFSD